jgi:hypothetical protein
LTLCGETADRVVLHPKLEFTHGMTLWLPADTERTDF